MDIDKLIQVLCPQQWQQSFGSLMDIDKLILNKKIPHGGNRFGSLMDIDKLIPELKAMIETMVLVL